MPAEEVISTIKIMSIIVPIIAIAIIIFTFVMIFSPKLRGKMMSRQIKGVKYMMDESKDDLTNIATTAGDIAAKTQKNILDQNEDILRDVATRKANVHKDAIETTVRAIKDGLSEKDTIYCKHCGKRIEKDSRFCKYCGKEQ